jgi:hypothetical protein
MNKEEKEQTVKKGYNKLLELLVKYGCNETVAKVLTGAVIGILVALFMTSCNTVTPTQIHSVHELYHDITGKQCIFDVEETDK